jgi:glycosyltransferase involved in cell wall biosynthesis
LTQRPATVVAPLGLDAREFDELPDKGRFRERYPQIGGRPIVLFLGRVHYGKGLELLAPAVARMRHSDAVLVIAGPDAGGYSGTINALVPQAAERLIYTGMLGGRDKLAALVDADLLALPSYHENFGLVVIEALAAGTPVVVSDQVNLHPEITAAGVGGVVPLDVDALARELDRWLDDDAMRHAAGAKGRAFVRERYDWDAIARHWIGHYERICGSGVAAAAGGKA